MVRVFVITPTATAGMHVATSSDEGSISEFINNAVGGWFDAVHPVYTDFNVVGYVHDEGLLLGLEPNPVASAMFGRFLVGNVVVVGTLNADGKYDGASHDVSDEAKQYLEWLCSAQQIWKDHLTEEPAV